MKKRRSKTQKQRKLYKNLVARIKSAQKRGYYGTEDLRKTVLEAYEKGKTQTLKKYTKNFYQYIKSVNIDTGEVFSGETGRAVERSIAAKKAAKTRYGITSVKEPPRQTNFNATLSTVALDNFYTDINSFIGGHHKHYPYGAVSMLNGISKLESLYGGEVVSQAIQEAYDNGYEIKNYHYYDDSYGTNFVNFVKHTLYDTGVISYNDYQNIMEDVDKEYGNYEQLI